MIKVHDLEIMKDISPLFEKKVIIWGIDEQTRVLLHELKDMGVRENIILCDSDSGQWGKDKEGYRIISPEQVQKIYVSDKGKGVVVCISFADVKLQDKVLAILEEMNLTDVVVYTRYGLKWGMYLNLKNRYIDDIYRKKMLAEHEKSRITYEEGSMVDQMKYFAYAPLHNDEMILIYQPGKVGSRSLYWSLKDYGKYVLHSHVLKGAEQGEDTLQKLLEQKSAKVISLVREPLARRISEMWQNIPSVNRYSAEVDFAEIEQFYFQEGFECQEFEWFHRELESVIGINVYDYPFDKEKGYAVIQKNNIELLLMQVEQLNTLEAVVGNFIGIPDFRLQNKNISKEKRYRFAYQAYLEAFTMPDERLKQIYYENPYMNFFYTEEEINGFYKMWLKD